MSPPVVRYGDLGPRMRALHVWERQRVKKEVHWAVELFAEAGGVFFYVYAGVGSTASFVIGNTLGIPGLGSLFQIGFAYALGIVFALGVFSSTSGGHFNPCVTLAYIIFKKFPPMKALRYIPAQIFGAYIACLLIYHQYKPLIKAAEEVLIQAGKFEEVNFTASGPAGIFALYATPGMTLQSIFLNEFVNCVFIAMVIWATLDPSNALFPPIAGPFVVAAAYACVIWGYATPNVSLNAARDLGGRFFSMTIYGSGASGGRYAAIAALTNIPATLFGAFLYEFFITDSDRIIPSQTVEFLHIAKEYRTLAHMFERDSSSQYQNETDEKDSDMDKPTIATFEHAQIHA